MQTTRRVGQAAQKLTTEREEGAGGGGKERESEGKGERRYRQTCDNVWTWLVRWTMNLL